MEWGRLGRLGRRGGCWWSWELGPCGGASLRDKGGAREVLGGVGGALEFVPWSKLLSACMWGGGGGGGQCFLFCSACIKLGTFFKKKISCLYSQYKQRARGSRVGWGFGL